MSSVCAELASVSVKRRFAGSPSEMIERAAASGGLEIVETEDGELIAVDRDGSFYSTKDTTGFVGNKPSKDAIDKLVGEIRKAEEVRLKKRKARGQAEEEGDVTYINDKNKQVSGPSFSLNSRRDRDADNDSSSTKNSRGSTTNTRRISARASSVEPRFEVRKPDKETRRYHAERRNQNYLFSCPSSYFTYTAVNATYEDGTNIIIFSFSSLVVSRNIGPPDRLEQKTLLPGKHSWQEKRTVYARNDELSPLIQVSRTYTITCIREDSMYC